MFYWQPKGLELGKWVVKESGWKNKPEGVYDVSAFTVAELGEMLPQYIRIQHGRIKKKRDFHLYMSKCWKGDGRYYVGYMVLSGDEPDFTLCAELNTEANARAKMLIYLIENKLIKLKENQ